MEHTAAKAEENLKTATLVPDYVTPEFKRKAAEQGIDPNKGKSREEKKTDRQKLLALRAPCSKVRSSRYCDFQLSIFIFQLLKHWQQ